jgi:diaminopimelate decarboxylase
MTEEVVWLDATLSIRGAHLWIEECDVVDLAAQFGTPLYVMSESQIIRNYGAYRRTFQAHWPHGDVSIYPSIKANFTLAVRRLLAAAGAGCDTFGENEVYAAIQAGTPGERISVNGSAKQSPLIERAVTLGASLVIDSLTEFDLAVVAAQKLGRRAQLLLRIKPAFDSVHAESDLMPNTTIRDATELYKPGLEFDAIIALLRRARRMSSVQVIGLMAHFGRHTADPTVWGKMAAAFGNAILSVCRAAHPWFPVVIDLGGGFPAPRDPTSPTGAPAPPLEAFAQEVSRPLANSLLPISRRDQRVELRIEPGRGLFADAGIHVSSVRHVKSHARPTAPVWIEVDTTEAFLPDLTIERARFTPVFASGVCRPICGRAHIVGASCGFDILARAVEAPDVQAGDVVAFLDTGAYQDAGASNFNALCRPATVLVTRTTATLVKRREATTDVFARDVPVESFALIHPLPHGWREQCP